MNFKQLRVFYEVARLGNFTAAAKRLSVSQPAVSLQIQALEETLGIRLCRRERGRLVLTEAGLLLQSYAERILLLADDVERKLESLRDAQSNSLRIATTKLIAAYSCFLPAVAGALKGLHEGTNIRLDIGTNAWAIEDVLTGDSDLGLVVNSSSDDLVRMTIFEDVLLVILPPTHAAARHRDTKLAFEHETLILREKGSRTRELVEDALRSRGISPKQTMELADAEAIKSAVRAGLGVSVITAMAVQEEAKTGTLAVMPFLDGEVRMRFEVIYRRDRELSPAMRTFLDALSPVDNADHPARRTMPENWRRRA